MRSRLDALQSLIVDEPSNDAIPNTPIHTGSEAVTQTGSEAFGLVQVIEISKIHRSPFQPRTFFNPDKIEKMAAKFRRYRERGTHPKTAILIRPLPNTDEYEFVFGESRTIAHTQAGFETVLAFVDAIPDDEARELAIAENLLREDLNAIEKTEAILELAAARLGVSPNEVRQLLDRAANQRKQDTNNVIRSEQWQKLVALFEELPGRITPDSFRANYLPLLNLPSDILDALHQGKLPYTKARAIAGLKDDQERSQLLTQAIEQDWSIRMIRDQIRDSKKSPSQSSETSVQIDLPLPERLGNLKQRLTRSKILQNAKHEKKVASWLSAIEAYIAKVENDE